MRIINQVPYTNNDFSKSGIRNNKLCSKERVRCNNSPSFEGLSLVVADKCANVVYNPLRNFSEFSIKEYSSLTPRQLKVLRSRFNHLAGSAYYYKNAEIIHAQVSDAIISNLNKKYGDDGYNLIILGRSMSSIGKVVGYKIGEGRVINIPMSRVSQCFHGPIPPDSVVCRFRRFLDSFGLTSEKVKSLDKKYVVMDYCYSGESLKAGTTLLKKTLNADSKIVSENPLSLIDDPSLRYATNISFLDCSFKQFSFVNKSYLFKNPLAALRNLKKADYETKLVWFQLIDDAVVGRKTNISELSKEYKHLLFREV